MFHLCYSQIKLLNCSFLLFLFPLFSHTLHNSDIELRMSHEINAVISYQRVRILQSGAEV